MLGISVKRYREDAKDAKGREEEVKVDFFAQLRVFAVIWI
jgi:hypothetical protein